MPQNKILLIVEPKTAAIFSFQAFVDNTTAKRIRREYFHWLIIFLSANENIASRQSVVVL